MKKILRNAVILNILFLGLFYYAGETKVPGGPGNPIWHFTN